MAQRRMMSLKVIDTDLFLDMPISTRLLYYDLCMRADDDGFVSSPKKIMKMVGANEDDYTILLAKRFIIKFDTGVCVIRHWRIHNLIRSDRYNPTTYIEEKNSLEIIDNKYDFKIVIPNDNQMEPQVRIGKDSLDKDSLDKDNNSIVDTSNNIKNLKEEYIKAIIYIVDYLNKKAGTNYKPNTNVTKQKIIARLKEGYKVEDFVTVIDKKVNDWINTDYAKYLRPETLFGNKFESYLKAPVTKPKTLKNVSLSQIEEAIEWEKQNSQNA